VFGEQIGGIAVVAGLMIFAGVALAGKNPDSRTIET